MEELMESERAEMRAAGKGILIDLGGVLVRDHLPALAGAWGRRLGMTPTAFLGAVFGGSDDQVLVGRVSEPDWWDVVAGRLGVEPGLVSELQRDLAGREVWDEELVAFVRGLRGRARTAVVSNAWPGTRDRLAAAGMLDVADHVVVSGEVGYAKPDPRIYQTALQRVGVSAGDALFIDDTAGHVVAAQSLGMSGHVHTGTAGSISRIEEFLGAA